MVRSNNGKQRQGHPEEGGGSTPAFTSSSQESNGAASSSSSESIRAKLGRAKEIEDGLEALRTNDNEGGDPTSTSTTKRNTTSSSSQENKSSSLRLQLCGILSDVILIDPAVAANVDAIGRMWKGCFYARINDLRSRIVKEKSRAKRRRREGGGADGGGGGGDDDSRRRIADVEKQLSTFLNESVQLYDYIIGRYVEELTTPPHPPTAAQSQSQQSRQSEDRTDNDDDDNDDDESSSSRRRLHVRIVVKSLHRMHIHLGDLHRYSSQYDAAEICYSRASRLAPGSGNAYNQLAESRSISFVDDIILLCTRSIANTGMYMFKRDWPVRDDTPLIEKYVVDTK